MTVAIWGVFMFCGGFGVGWIARLSHELSVRRNRRGGYVRRVPMSSLHPREPKS